MAFEPLYSGRGTAFRPDISPLLEENRRLGEKLVQAKAIDINDQLRREKEYMEAVDLDPVSMINEKNSLAQAKMIDEFSKKAGEIYKSKQGRLSTEDKLAIQTEQRKIANWQARKLADQKRFEKEYEVINSDIKGDYDKNYFRQGMVNYLETGEYPTGGLLEVSGIDPATYFGKYKSNEFKQNEVIIGNKQITTYGALEDKKKFVENTLLGEQGYRLLKGAQNAFLRLPQEKQQEYFENAAPGENPIINFAKDEYAPKIMPERVDALRPRAGGADEKVGATTIGEHIYRTPGDNPLTYTLNGMTPTASGARRSNVGSSFTGFFEKGKSQKDAYFYDLSVEQVGGRPARILTSDTSIAGQNLQVIDYDPDKQIMILRSQEDNGKLYMAPAKSNIAMIESAFGKEVADELRKAPQVSFSVNPLHENQKKTTTTKSDVTSKWGSYKR